MAHWVRAFIYINEIEFSKWIKIIYKEKRREIEKRKDNK